MTRDETVGVLRAQAARFDDLKVKGKATAYLAINGNMFAFVDPSGDFCLRIAEPDRAVFEAEGYDPAPVIRYGSVMRGYVTLPARLVADRDGIARWFDRSLAFARDLKPTRKAKG